MTTDVLAINGGAPYRVRPFATYANASGRSLGDEEKQLLAEVIDSGALNRNDGSKVAALERAWAEMLGVPHAQAVTSGTAALHTAVAALNLEPGDEIITSPITDMGTVIAILACNLVPTFADVDPRTGNITAETIARQISPKTRAIIVVHLFGQPADMDPILALARQHDLRVIEDCAQAHLAAYQGRLVGTMGDLGCFSFQQSKQMTTGDGGLVVSRDEALAVRARLFSDKGWPRGIPGLRGHLFLGMNYRMTELQGAVGLAQARKLPGMVAQRRRTAGSLRELVAAIPGLIPPYIAARRRARLVDVPVHHRFGSAGRDATSFRPGHQGRGAAVLGRLHSQPGLRVRRDPRPQNVRHVGHPVDAASGPTRHHLRPPGLSGHAAIPR